MIYNSNESTRRTLYFPAVKPCESISQTTLVNSLLSLSKKISNYKPPHFTFTSNKRNVKKALRLIQVLQLFLQGVRDAGGFDMMGNLVNSPLLDLHVALQKLEFVLQDCTRQDARVWMLMKSNSVGRHFRVVFEAVAASLDDLPLDVVGACDDEVKELGLFLIQKVKQAHFEAQREDVWASNLVKSALYRFEGRVIPDPSEFRWVLDYLGIKKWAECNDQVKFLEEEIGFGSGPAARLMGLMVYCRCVFFYHIDGDARRVEDAKFDYNIGCLNPDDLKCPISLEIMEDPVTISTGQTYDRVNIVKWFKASNPVCPKTGQRVQNLDLVPNLALKEIIKKYCLENGETFPIPKDKGASKKSSESDMAVLAIEEATKMVADFLSLKLAMGTIGEKSKAAYEIRLLTKRSVFNRACFMESGAISYLLNLLLSKDSTAQENSMGALLNLSKHPEIKPVIVNNGGLILVVRVLKNGIKMEARQHAAATLFYLSSVEEYRGLIGNNPDAIPSLAELIRIGGDQGRKNALVSIFSLLMLPSNHNKVLEAKLVPLLVSLVGSMEISDNLIVDFLAVLTSLAEKPHGARAIFRAKALDVVIRLMCSPYSDSSRLGKENCVSLLLAMCINCGREVVEILVMNTSLMGALYSLYAGGTSRVSKKISSLISILHEFSERSTTRSMPRALSHENFIHVW
ncbi:U-box domain-containing protein 19-like [Chenopodium quinoa]|uniref:RING-type E3 ubiquitin transferase n=1 Tax=Chenopodium quinoa TaxID=63459 RepID=A0A803L0I0_CHEQI|nr:U-box domain-containing protein 19-like [Chenopodium quinoa]